MCSGLWAWRGRYRLSLSLSLALALLIVVVLLLLSYCCCCRSNSQHSCNFCGKQFHGSDLTSFGSLPLALHIPPSIALFCLGQILMSLSLPPILSSCLTLCFLCGESLVEQLMNMLSAWRGRWQMLSRAQFLIFWADTSLHRVCECVCVFFFFFVCVCVCVTRLGQKSIMATALFKWQEVQTGAHVA